MKNKSKLFYKSSSFVISSFLVLLLFFGCVSQKRKGEVGKVGKAYHNVTAKYNGYFNANELLQNSITKLKETHRENYNQILPIYPEIAVDNPEIVAQDLDKAIEKVSVVATRHEPSVWVDDCYVLLGKAQFLKQDWETAEESFSYFVEEFDPSNARRKLKKKSKKRSKRSSTSKRKTNSKKKKVASSKRKKQKKSTKKRGSKKRSSKRGTKKRTPKTEKSIDETKLASQENSNKEKSKKAEKLNDDDNKDENTITQEEGSNGVFKHLPAYPEGLLWLAKTSIKRDKHSLADYYLKKITEQNTVEKEVLREIPVVKAFSTLDQKRYAEAIVHLDEAIPNTKDKQRKARFLFIKAQLLQREGNIEAANSAFKEVIKLKPDFQLEFNAELNILKSSGDVADVEKKLERMLKEDKYGLYQDQIYYTLGEIKYNNGLVAESIPLYQQSISHNQDNNTQLVESYYRLATIFYGTEDYLMSHNYYDSTSTVISKLDPRFKEVTAYNENLKDIAKNIEIVELQDSLIKIASMTREEQEVVARQRKVEELSKEAAQANDNASSGKPQFNGIGTVNSNPTGVKSTFFAYNDTKREKGKQEFQKQWGLRNLENNWRRSAAASQLSDITDISSTTNLSLTDTEIEEILKDVPFSPQAKAAANSKIREALFELGILYRDKIQNYQKSVEAHERLINDFRGVRNEAETLYYLYLSFSDLNNETKATYYLNQLKSKFPDNKFTLALTDPSYVSKTMDKGKMQQYFYDETYAAFEAGDYSNVEARANEAATKFNPNEFAPHYGLLKAMSIGKKEGKDAYIKALKDVVGTYPNTSIQTKAKEILRFLQGDKEAFDKVEADNLDRFNIDDDKLHYTLVVIYSDDNTLQNAVRISTNKYNRKYHKVDKIRASTVTLNTETGVQVILMRKWDNKDDAMKYYDEIKRNSKEFIENDVEYDTFVVTQQNYREIMKQRSVKEYKTWFNLNYLSNR